MKEKERDQRKKERMLCEEYEKGRGRKKKFNII